MNIFSKVLHKKIAAIVLAAVFVIAIASVVYFYGKNSDTSITRNDSSLNLKIADKKDIKILFVGDMMFDRYIRQVSDLHGSDFIFQNVETLLKNNDLVVGNLEGPITDNVSASVNSEIGSKANYVFTFDPKFADILKKENVGLVNIGNNHIGNFGDAGISSTEKYLSNAKVEYFGDPQDENKRIAMENIGGWKIAFVNYNQFSSDAEKKTLDDIKKAKDEKVDFIFLYTHWGTEFVPEPGEKIKNLAHEFVDAGADLIIGTHPHVIQSEEEYKGKKIYYSLGNFILDQYFRPETQVGLAVEVDVSAKNGTFNFSETKIRMKSSGQTIL